MKRTYLLVVACATLVLLGSLSTAARAWDGGLAIRPPITHLPGHGMQGATGFPLFYGAYRSSSSLYSLGYTFVPPYFSLHPPAYYSLPQPRPYGDSPFAWPGERPIIVPLPAPPIFHNPMVEPVAQPQAEQTAASPQTIINPYCEQLVSVE